MSRCEWLHSFSAIYMYTSRKLVPQCQSKNKHFFFFFPTPLWNHHKVTPGSIFSSFSIFPPCLSDPTFFPPCRRTKVPARPWEEEESSNIEKNYSFQVNPACAKHDFTVMKTRELSCFSKEMQHLQSPQERYFLLIKALPAHWAINPNFLTRWSHYCQEINLSKSPCMDIRRFSLETCCCVSLYKHLCSSHSCNSEDQSLLYNSYVKFQVVSNMKLVRELLRVCKLVLLSPWNVYHQSYSKCTCNLLPDT